MLEITFNDSAKGGLKCAMNHDELEWLRGSGTSTGEKPAWAEIGKSAAGKLSEKTPVDVVGLSFLLDVGDVSGDVTGEVRTAVIWNMYGHAFDGEKDPSFLRFIQNNVQDLVRVREATAHGESIRVWHGSSPRDACGFRHLMWEIRDCSCPVWEVSLPRLRACDEDEVEELTDWAEVEPGQFSSFLDESRELPPLLRKKLELDWMQAMEENAPLRAMINGRLTGVAEDFYDPVLRRCMPEGEFVMARLIGEALGRYPLGVSDCWYAHRIRAMVASGELIVVGEGDGDHPYSMRLCKR